ncbi:MAG: hypothetical protein GX034_02665 [Clostridiaceae bacterium]|jgi:hypothetical protein|nr:hypothetical protein [Clostridiaceae bacterium]
MEKLEWQISVPIFRNTVILKQLGLAIGIPFGLVVLVIVLASGKSVYAIYGLSLIALLFLLTWLLLMVVYRGRYELEFIMDEGGVTCRTQTKQAGKNRIINGLTIALGLLSGKATTVGSGMLAQSKQEVFLPWKRISKVKYKRNNYTILLRAGPTEQIALFCTADNYPQVERELMLRRTDMLVE